MIPPSLCLSLGEYHSGSGSEAMPYHDRDRDGGLRRGDLLWFIPTITVVNENQTNFPYVLDGDSPHFTISTRINAINTILTRF